LHEAEIVVFHEMDTRICPIRRKIGSMSKQHPEVWNASRREPGFVDFCPICVFLLESEEGQLLFEQNMVAEIHIVNNGQGHAISSVGWHCQMCGASGEGEIPQFHEKPGGKGT
jgi:hypothetical protein